MLAFFLMSQKETDLLTHYKSELLGLTLNNVGNQRKCMTSHYRE